MRFTAEDLVQGSMRLIPWSAATTFSAFVVALSGALLLAHPGEDLRVAVWNGFQTILWFAVPCGLAVATGVQLVQAFGRTPPQLLAADLPFIAGLLIGWIAFASLVSRDDLWFELFFFSLLVPLAVIFLGPTFFAILWWSGIVGRSWRVAPWPPVPTRQLLSFVLLAPLLILLADPREKSCHGLYRGSAFAVPMGIVHIEAHPSDWMQVSDVLNKSGVALGLSFGDANIFWKLRKEYPLDLGLCSKDLIIKIRPDESHPEQYVDMHVYTFGKDADWKTPVKALAQVLQAHWHIDASFDLGR